MAKKITVAVLILFSLYLFHPFLGAVGMGAIFAVIFHPLMIRIDRGRFPNSLAAGLVTLGVTLVIFLPLSGVMIGSVKSGLNELARIRRLDPKPTEAASSEVVLDKMFVSSGIDSFLERTARVLPMDAAQVSDQLKDLIANLTARVGQALSLFIGRIPDMMVAFTVFLFALFYFMADGVQFLQEMRKKSFFTQVETEKLFTTFAGLCRSVILASVVTGGLQAVLATIVSFAVGLRQPLLLLPILFIASFVPVVGSFPIIVGLGLYQIFSGHLVGGLILALSAVVIATLDNFVRPQIIRGGSNLHPLWSFVSALGGLEVFGMNGLFLGPVVCGMMVETVKIVQASHNGDASE